MYFYKYVEKLYFQHKCEILFFSRRIVIQEDLRTQRCGFLNAALLLYCTAGLVQVKSIIKCTALVWTANTLTTRWRREPKKTISNNLRRPRHEIWSVSERMIKGLWNRCETKIRGFSLLSLQLLPADAFMTYNCFWAAQIFPSSCQCCRPRRTVQVRPRDLQYVSQKLSFRDNRSMNETQSNYAAFWVVFYIFWTK